MPLKDMHSEVHATPLLAAAAISADNTQIWVDTRGYEAVEILLSIGVGGITFSGTNKVEYKLYESDASDGTGATLVADADIMGVTPGGTGILKSLTAAHSTAANYRFGYRGSKRYIGLLADFSGTHGTATPMAASAVLMRPHNSPVENAA